MKKLVTTLLKKCQKQRGSTLIELLIATMVVGTVITAVAAGVTRSVKNNSEAQYREIATVLAQQGVEMFRSERNNLGWVTFHNDIVAGTYCIPAGADELGDLSTDLVNCAVTESNFDFNRQVVLTKTSGADPGVTLEVTVQWDRRSGSMSDVKVTQTFKDYE